MYTRKALVATLCCSSMLLLGNCRSGQDSSQDGGAADGAQAVPPVCEPTTCDQGCRSQGGEGGHCTNAGRACSNVPASCALGEKVSCYAGPAGTAGRGSCKAGSVTCVPLGELATWSACEGEALPSAESCNGVDDDCDGTADEGLSCKSPGETCAPGDECTGGTRCTELPDGRRSCEDLPVCANSSGCKGSGEECTEFPYPDEKLHCYDRPRLTCWAHYLFDYVQNGVGHHNDTCMNCQSGMAPPELREGSLCAAGAGPDLECSGVMFEVWKANGGGGGPPAVSFLTFSQPIHVPAGFTQCLFAWGVHPLRSISVERKVVARLPGVPGASLSASGLSTRLPAATFQHSFVEAPPRTQKPVPSTKSERGARVFWEEPSVANLRQAPLHAPYSGCATCTTFGELVDHLYPGPEIYCQGLPRDPADSQFVVPIWMPYYESLHGTPNLVIISEAVCQTANGKLSRSVTAMALPAESPSSYPVTY